MPDSAWTQVGRTLRSTTQLAEQVRVCRVRISSVSRPPTVHVDVTDVGPDSLTKKQQTVPGQTEAQRPLLARGPNRPIGQ